MSKLIHGKCGGELNVALGDGGELYVICPACVDAWTVTLQQVPKQRARFAAEPPQLPGVDNEAMSILLGT